MQNQENETPEVEVEAQKAETSEVREEAEVEQSPPSPEVEPALRSDEIIEVPWEEVEQLYRIREYSKQLDGQLADICLRFEKTKQNLLSRISECETFLFNSGTTLKDSKNIDPAVSYELKLPKEEGEKAFFVRKDS